MAQYHPARFAQSDWALFMPVDYTINHLLSCHPFPLFLLFSIAEILGSHV